MRKKIIIISSIILALILIFKLSRFRFSSTEILVRDIPFKKIESLNCRFWKENGGGYAITNCDVLSFDQSHCLIKNDTLYMGNQPIAKATSLTKRCLSFDYELTIKSLDGEKTGRYVSK